MITRTVAFSILLSTLLLRSAHADDKPGSSEITKWKDGKKAVFMLAFDDGCPSQLKNVIPELNKRKIPGTFYLVTGNKLWGALHKQWEEATKSPYVVVANHTFTHEGVKSLEELPAELSKCNEVLYALQPDRKQPRFLPFGTPGGVPWKVSEDELRAALAQHHLINRPSFQGPPIHYKSADECVAVIDQAIAKGGVGHHDMHGVGGDWLVTPLDWFIAIVDKLDANRDQLWITNPASLHKYTTERDSAEIQTLESTPNRIRLTLKTKADPALYDESLTLNTKVPKSWVKASVQQGSQTQDVTAKGGIIQYSALPGAEEIVIVAPGA